MVKLITPITVLFTVARTALAVSCLDSLPASAFANSNEAVDCINYLAGLGGQPCTGTVSGTSFCWRGNTQITGIAPNGGSSTSSCQDVARGAGQIMDNCSRGDGKVKGQNPAWGNGNLIVDIRSV
ncbi:hypothetical protein FALBO_12540 [Fusarium albosuccineum]|uniref:Uncharacterized protein n=1 Tax=Fusarium albosuccineum TaxID=1237068 RepID=A0A8H4L367_9HYPO|nr:hypothetical protein FALBO_12540 [Fusarium albosuccineum]